MFLFPFVLCSENWLVCIAISVFGCHHSVLSCVFSPSLHPGLLKVLTGRERKGFLWPTVWTGYKFPDIKPLTILFSGCSSLLYSPWWTFPVMTWPPTSHKFDQISDLYTTTWLAPALISASSHLYNRRVFHPPRWRCSFHPFQSARSSCLISDSTVPSLAVCMSAVMNLEPLPGQLSRLQIPMSNHLLDISTQICHRKFQFNMS